MRKRRCTTEEEIPPKRVKAAVPSSIAMMRKEEQKWYKERSNGGRNARQKIDLVESSDRLKMPTKLGPILGARFKDLPLERDGRSERIT